MDLSGTFNILDKNFCTMVILIPSARFTFNRMKLDETRLAARKQRTHGFATIRTTVVSKDSQHQADRRLCPISWTFRRLLLTKQERNPSMSLKFRAERRKYAYMTVPILGA